MITKIILLLGPKVSHWLVLFWMKWPIRQRRTAVCLEKSGAEVLGTHTACQPRLYKEINVLHDYSSNTEDETQGEWGESAHYTSTELAFMTGSGLKNKKRKKERGLVYGLPWTWMAPLDPQHLIWSTQNCQEWSLHAGSGVGPGTENKAKTLLGPIISLLGFLSCKVGVIHELGGEGETQYVLNI